MDLSKIDTKTLEKELFYRKNKSNFEQWNIIPDNPLKYEEIRKSDSTNFYLLSVVDGSEGLQYLVECNDDILDNDLIDVVKHHLLTNGIEPHIDSWHIIDIRVEDISRYGLTFLRVI